MAKNIDGRMHAALTRCDDRAAVEAVELAEARFGDVNPGIFGWGAYVDQFDRITRGEDFVQFLDGYGFHGFG